jgi:hypothetical protein
MPADAVSGCQAMRLFFLSLLSIVGLLSAGPSGAAAELEDRAIISASTQDAFLREDFSKLEEVSRVYRDEKTRTSSGLWKLTLFYNGIENAIYARAYVQEREAAFRELEGKTTRWAQRYPTSPTAHIAHSVVLIHHAWAFRGAEPDSAVKQEARAPFRKYLALARENLETHKAVAAADPRWYETMLTVAAKRSGPGSRHVLGIDRLAGQAEKRLASDRARVCLFRGHCLKLIKI